MDTHDKENDSMSDMVTEEACIRAAERLRKKYPDERILFGETPREPTAKMVAAGASVIRDCMAEHSENWVKRIWEVMWAASEDERSY